MNEREDLTLRLPSAWRAPFAAFLETGEAEAPLLDYLDADPLGREVLECALDRQASELRGLKAALGAPELEPATLPAEPQASQEAITALEGAMIAVARMPSQDAEPVIRQVNAFLEQNLDDGQRKRAQAILTALAQDPPRSIAAG